MCEWFEKNLTFPNYEFGKGQYAVILSRFAVNFVNIPVLGLGKEVPLWIGRLGKYAKRSDVLHSESNE